MASTLLYVHLCREMIDTMVIVGRYLEYVRKGILGKTPENNLRHTTRTIHRQNALSNELGCYGNPSIVLLRAVRLSHLLE